MFQLGENDVGGIDFEQRNFYLEIIGTYLKKRYVTKQWKNFSFDHLEQLEISAAEVNSHLRTPLLHPPSPSFVTSNFSSICRRHERFSEPKYIEVTYHVRRTRHDFIASSGHSIGAKIYFLSNNL